eukprot:COSAG05_NODE_39_length_27555_cov_750.282925_19_plen_262_part_00
MFDVAQVRPWSPVGGLDLLGLESQRFSENPGHRSRPAEKVKMVDAFNGWGVWGDLRGEGPVPFASSCPLTAEERSQGLHGLQRRAARAAGQECVHVQTVDASAAVALELVKEHERTQPVFAPQFVRGPRRTARRSPTCPMLAAAIARPCACMHPCIAIRDSVYACIVGSYCRPNQWMKSMDGICVSSERSLSQIDRPNVDQMLGLDERAVAAQQQQLLRPYYVRLDPALPTHCHVSNVPIHWHAAHALAPTVPCTVHGTAV